MTHRRKNQKPKTKNQEVLRGSGTGFMAYGREFPVFIPRKYFLHISSHLKSHKLIDMKTSPQDLGERTYVFADNIRVFIDELLYSIAVKEIYGRDKGVRLIWHYLSFNKKINIKRTNEQLEKLKKDTIELIKGIETTTDFYPTKSPLCHWCEYKPICPAWGNKPPEKQTNLDDFSFKMKED